MDHAFKSGRDRDRDERERSTPRPSHHHHHSSHLPPSRNRLPPAATSSASALYSPPLRVSSLPNAASPLSTLPLPVLPPTAPAAHRHHPPRPSHHASHRSHSPLVSSTPHGSLRNGSSATNVPARSTSVTGAAKRDSRGGTRSRSPSVVSSSDPRSATTPSGAFIAANGYATVTKKDEDSDAASDERKKEELKRLERAERFGISNPATTATATASTPAVGTSRSRLEGIQSAFAAKSRLESTPLSSRLDPVLPASSTASYSAAAGTNAKTDAPTTTSIATGSSASTGFRIPYKDRTSRSRKRSRQQEDEDAAAEYEQRDLYSRESRNASPPPEPSRERERDRNASRWDRGSDRFADPQLQWSGQPKGRKFAAGYDLANEKLSQSSFARLPFDPATPCSNDSPVTSTSSRRSNHYHHSDSRFAQIGNLSNLGNGTLTNASKPSSRTGSSTSTPRARSPVDHRDRASDRGWERLKERQGGPRSLERTRGDDRRDDDREGSRFAPASDRRRDSRSYSTGEVPESVRARANNSPPPPSPRLRTRRSRSRSISHNRTRSRSPDGRSHTPPFPARGGSDSQRWKGRTLSEEEGGYHARPKLEDEEELEAVPVSDTPPLPAHRLLRSPPPSAQTFEPSDTPPRPPSMPLPAAPAARSEATTAHVLPSRRRLPPSAIVESPAPLAAILPLQFGVDEERPLPLLRPRVDNDDEEELEEGEEKEEGEIVAESSSSSRFNAVSAASYPSRSRIPAHFRQSSSVSISSRSPPPPLSPPPRSSRPPRAPSPISTTPPRRQALAETRGETPPLRSSRTVKQDSPSSSRDRPLLAASRSETKDVDATRHVTYVPDAAFEVDKEREEGEICSEADSIAGEEEPSKKRPEKELPPRPNDVEQEPPRVVEGNRETAADRDVGSTGEAVAIVEEKVAGVGGSRAEEEDVEMVASTVAQEKVREQAVEKVASEEVRVATGEEALEVKKDGPIREVRMQIDDGNVDGARPATQEPVQQDHAPITSSKEEEAANASESRMELDDSHAVPTPTTPLLQQDALAALVELVEQSPGAPGAAAPTPEQPQRAESETDPNEAAHPSSTTPLDHHSPPQPISPPTKHIPSGSDGLPLLPHHLEPVKPDAASALADLDTKMEPPARFVDRDTWFLPTWGDFAMRQSLMIPFLLEQFGERDQRRGEKMVDLRKQYRNLEHDWQAHIKRLDKFKERQQRKMVKHSSNSTAPQTPSIDSSGMPYWPEPVTPGPLALGGGRANRRGGGGGLSNSTWGYGDAVRSEAEFLEILASLENADLRDPDVRAARTAAVVPDMAVDPSERAEIIACTFDDERYRVEDPVEAYGVSTPMEPWTEAEVETFCKGYSQHPKQFAKIAQNLAGKSTAECVLFYYRMKNAIDFRSLSERRGRDGRRKKAKKRPGEGKGKGSSLLSNLKGAKSTMLGNRGKDDDDDDEEEEDRGSHLASPRNTRPPLPPSNESSTLLPTGGAATPRPLPGPLERLFDDDDMDDASPSGIQKHGRNPRNAANLPLLHSEGTIEAAEVLGGLAASPADDKDESGGPSSLRPRAAKTNRKVRMELDDDGAIETASNEKSKPRRKANSSSYWSAAEKADIVRLLEQHGKNWKAIGEEMGSKTPVQCRNWFTNNAKKLGLRNLVNGTAGQEFDEQEDESPSVTPLVQSPAVIRGSAAGPAHLSYFPTPDAQHLPPLPSIPLSAPKASSITSKAGMHLRNMLNEDTPDEEAASNSAKEDWFGSGGGGGGGGGAPDDEPSEDESQSASAQSSRPVTATDHGHSLQGNRIILSNGLARSSSHLPGPAQLPSFPTSLPNRRFDHFLPRQAATIPISSRWSPAPASPFASYGGSPVTLGAPSPSSSTADHYRRPTPPDYFQAKTVYSHPQLQAHQHQNRFSSVPGPLQPSPPIPSSSSFTPSSALPSSAAMYSNGWTPEPRR